MLKVLMSFLLFTIPVNTRNEVEIVRCNESETMIELNDEIYKIEYFNILFFNDESKMQACEYLLDAKRVTMELEPLANQSEPLPAYLFVDSILIQKIIIEEGLGRIAVRMNEYKYEEAMEKAAVEPVMATHQEDETIQQNYNYSYLIILGLIIVCLGKGLRQLKR